MKELSIIIVNYNQTEILQECLTSIINHTHDTAYEIIVIDNGSTDDPSPMLKQNFPEVKLIRNKENLGFSKANNLGIEIAEGKHLLFLNNDTVVKPSALDKMVKYLDRDPEAGAIGPKLLNTNGTIQREGSILGNKFWQSKIPICAKFIIGAALMARASVIEQVGPFDENLFFYNDDLDLCQRIRKAGWKICFFPEAEIIHYGGYSSRKSFNPVLFVEGFKGGLYYVRKHFGESAYFFYRIMLCIFMTMALPFHILNPEKLKAYLKIISIAQHGQIPEPMLK